MFQATRAIQSMAVAMGLLNSSILANPIALVLAAIAGTIVLIATNWHKLSSGIGGYIDKIKEAKLETDAWKVSMGGEVDEGLANVLGTDTAMQELEKAKGKFGSAFDEVQFRATNPNVLRNQQTINDISGRFKLAMDSGDLSSVKKLIEDLEIADPETGSKNWTDVRQFNLMFKTELGSVAGDASTIYLRPETAQGIFVNFLNVTVLLVLY